MTQKFAPHPEPSDPGAWLLAEDLGLFGSPPSGSAGFPFTWTCGVGGYGASLLVVLFFEVADPASGCGFFGVINWLAGARATGMGVRAGGGRWGLCRGRESRGRGLGADLKRVWRSYRGRHEVRDGDQWRETVKEGNERHPAPGWVVW